MSSFHDDDEEGEGEEEGGGVIFDYLDAEEKEEIGGNNNVERSASNQKVYRNPVNLYQDDQTGEQYFYLQKWTFPNRSITDLKIIYTPEEKAQVREQVLANKTCPEVLLKNVKVKCTLGDAIISTEMDQDPKSDYLTDESFRLSGSKIVAIRMRMYARQKMQAEKQLEDPKCSSITLQLDIECRLGSRDAPAQ